MTTQPLMRVSRSSNLAHLPFVFFLPEEHINKCPTLRSLPRKVREIFHNEELMNIVNSDQFLNEIMDASAYLVFSYFGFRGWKEDYSGNFPAWKLSYSLGLWSQLLEREVDWGLQRLFEFPSSMEIPFFDNEYINVVLKNIVYIGLVELNLKPILAVIKKYPCFEDFDLRRSRVKTDFYRSWHHTRSKKVKTVPYDECLKGVDEDYHTTIAVDPRNMAELVASDDYCQRFKKLLSERDLEILELREDGFTFEEIADKLEYKTHSAVVKRMQAIKEEYLKYASKK